MSVNLDHTLQAILGGPGENIDLLLVFLGQFFVITRGLFLVDLDVFNFKGHLVHLEKREKEC